MFRYCFDCSTVSYSAAAMRPGERCIRCSGDRLAGTVVRAVPSPHALLIDSARNVLWASHQAGELLGRDPVALQARPLSEVLELEEGRFAEDLIEARQPDQAVIRGRPLSCAARIVEAGATHRDLTVHLVPTESGHAMLFLWLQGGAPRLAGERERSDSPLNDRI